MENVIHKLNRMIALNKSDYMTKEQEYYVSGLCDALQVIEESLAESLVPGNSYYVIMYRDGNKYVPYIQKMKLYKVSQGAVKTSYCFTTNLENRRIRENPDLVLQSKKGLSERVFFTYEQAEKAIAHM